MTGVFYCHHSNAGVERTLNKSQHTKLTLERKIIPMLLPGFELTSFDHESGALTNNYLVIVVGALSPVSHKGLVQG